MRTLTRDKLAKISLGDQEIIRFFEEISKQSGTLPDGDYGDVSVAGGLIQINPGVVGLNEVSADVLNRANQTGFQAIATVSGLQSALDGKQATMGFAAVVVNFGAAFGSKAQTVVTGQSWVTATSKIVADVATPSGIDPDEVFLLNLRPVISNLIAGVGFTVTLYSDAQARGSYTVNCMGL